MLHSKQQRLPTLILSSSSSWWVLLLLMTVTSIKCQSYRVGDTIHTTIRGQSSETLFHHHKIGPIEAYRRQMPLFGISTSTYIDHPAVVEQTQDQHQHQHDDHEDHSHDTLIVLLSFDNGAKTIPWFTVHDTTKGLELKELVVRFTYSASGGGEIHAIHAKKTYETTFETKEGGGSSDREGKESSSGSATKKRFRVQYVWEEEEDVDLQRGVMMMFLILMTVVIAALIDVCCNGVRHYEDDDDDYYYYRKENNVKEENILSADFPGYQDDITTVGGGPSLSKRE